MLYAELGRRPLEIQIKSRMIGYWISLVNAPNTKFSQNLYRLMLAESINGQNYKWINCIENILISVGKPDLLTQPFTNNPQATRAKIVQTLNDLYVQEWNTKLNASSKGKNYNLFKQDLLFETYLTSLNRNLYISMIKFRTCNYRLPVEKSRWENIPMNERKCILCDKNDIGDSFHYLLICPVFRNERLSFLKPYYYKRPNTMKFRELMCSTNKSILLGLSKFMIIIMNKFP